MTSVSTGRQAESAAVEYLKQAGYKILDQNWRTRLCEIDIVAQKAECVYFVEVKYRKSTDWGGGLEYITAKKQKQMEFAAEFWVVQHKWKSDYCLSAIELTGASFNVTNFLPNL